MDDQFDQYQSRLVSQRSGQSKKGINRTSRSCVMGVVEERALLGAHAKEARALSYRERAFGVRVSPANEWLWGRFFPASTCMIAVPLTALLEAVPKLQALAASSEQAIHYKAYDYLSCREACIAQCITLRIAAEARTVESNVKIEFFNINRKIK
ncbi:hypothetical protein [Zymobacter palmae]|uniref:hypothetical protein n=1 Tax=Zymobacter palmae TaxID=33074 RepID=UPI0011AE9B32|nr:hypothetical protein [Zymobacter palmae]